MADVLAWAGIPALLALVACHPLARKRKGVRWMLWVIVLAHCGASVTNAYLQTLPGTGGDDVAFHEMAAAGQLDHFRSEAGLYVRLLHELYDLVGVSKFLAQQLSVAAFCLACLLLLEIVRHLGVEREAPLVLAVFGLLPTMVVFSSVTLREAYLIFFLLLAVVSVLKIAYEESVLGYFFVVASCSGMGALHKAMVPLSLFFLVLSVVFLFAVAVKRGSGLKRAFVSFLLATVLFFGIAHSFHRSIVLQAYSHGRIIDLVTRHRSVRGGRTDYSAPLELSSMKGLIKTGPTVLGLYLFSPFPWQAKTALDLYSALESILRLALILGMVSFIFKARDSKLLVSVYLFTLFWAVEIIWAAGTSNWGTAARHRTVVFFVLVVLGVPAWLRVFGRGRPPTGAENSPAAHI